jgi:hypothetical protein
MSAACTDCRASYFSTLTITRIFSSSFLTKWGISGGEIMKSPPPPSPSPLPPSPPSPLPPSPSPPPSPGQRGMLMGMPGVWGRML